MNDKELLKEILGLSDSVYIPNDTKDYTGVKIMVDVNSIAALVARREALLIEKLQNWGSWMTDHCDNHQKYTSACCGCQRASHALHTIESYKDWQTRELAALTTEATQSGKEEQ